MHDKLTVKIICTSGNYCAIESKGSVLFSAVIQLKGKRDVLYTDRE